MPHVTHDCSVQLGRVWVGGVRELRTHQTIYILWGSWFVFAVQYHEEVCVRQAALLKFNRISVSDHAAEDVMLSNVLR